MLFCVLTILLGDKMNPKQHLPYPLLTVILIPVDFYIYLKFSCPTKLSKKRKGKKPNAKDKITCLLQV